MAPIPLARRVYLWTAWLFLASLFVQVFTIGLYLFADFDIGLHFLGALLLFIVSIVVLVVTFVARLPGRSKALAGGLLVLTVIQGILAGLRYAGLGLVAALHPVNALVLFWLGLVVLRDAQAHARAPAMAEPVEGAAPEAAGL